MSKPLRLSNDRLIDELDRLVIDWLQKAQEDTDSGVNSLWITGHTMRGAARQLKNLIDKYRNG